MEKEMLLDNFVFKGTSLEGLMQDIKTLSDATETAVINGKQVMCMSLDRCQEHYTAKVSGKTLFYTLDADNVFGINNYGDRLHLGAVKNEQLGDVLLEELKAQTGLMLHFNDSNYIVSQKALKTIAARAGLSGTQTITRHNLARDLHLADALIARAEDITFIYRHTGEVKKIFAALSGKCIVPKPDIVCAALEHPDFPFKDFKIRQYCISNFLTEIRAELPSDDAVFTPGFVIKYSDVGESSFKLKCVVGMGESYVIASETSLPNIKNAFNLNTLMEKLQVAYDSFSKESYTNDLMALKGKYILDYDAVDLTGKRNVKKNGNRAEEIIAGICKKLFTELSVKQLHKVISTTIPKIKPENKIDLFDICIAIIESPDTIELTDNAEYTKTSMRTALYRLPQTLLEMAG